MNLSKKLIDQVISGVTDSRGKSGRIRESILAAKQQIGRGVSRGASRLRISFCVVNRSLLNAIHVHAETIGRYVKQAV